MRARAPASSANLGPGFDTLAVAVDRYVQRRGRARGRAVGAHRGGGCGPLRRRHASRGAGRHRGARTRPHRGDRPVADPGGTRPRILGGAGGRGRGRGRSRGSLCRRRRARRAPRERGGQRLRRAGGGDDGRGPAGLRTAASQPGPCLRGHGPRAQLWRRPRRGRLLPETLGRADAVFNLGRMALLLAGLARPAALVSQAMEDRLHQPARTALFPEAPALLRGAGRRPARWRRAGRERARRCSAWSPPRRLEAVRDRAESVLASSGVPGQVLALRPDLDGIDVRRRRRGRPLTSRPIPRPRARSRGGVTGSVDFPAWPGPTSSAPSGAR